MLQTEFREKIRKGYDLLFAFRQYLTESVIRRKGFVPRDLTLLAGELQLHGRCAQQFAFRLESVLEVLVEELLTGNLGSVC